MIDRFNGGETIRPALERAGADSPLRRPAVERAVVQLLDGHRH